MSDVGKLLVHWINVLMPTQPEYAAWAIKRHFAMAPWDEPVMRPRLEAAWKQLKERANASA